MKGFYEAAKGDAETKFTYPDIMPSVMASLSELLDVRLSVQDVMLRFLHVLKEHSGRIFSDSLSVEEWPLYEAYLTRVVERNDKVFDSLKED